MARISDKGMNAVKKMVEREFPDDPASREVHITRKIIAGEAEPQSIELS
ncbi:MAG: hypothetical protein JW759_04725 [Candidatus Coatesbacteria bacterium]|nr:hypothetical protein [Candidatus Coatesbacteria bacterium]